MLSEAIVPKGQRVWLPIYPAGQSVGLADVIKQHAQHRPTFCRVQPLDAGSEVAVQKQNLLAGFWMPDDHRVLIARVAITLRWRNLVVTQVRQGTIVNCG